MSEWVLQRGVRVRPHKQVVCRRDDLNLQTAAAAAAAAGGAPLTSASDSVTQYHKGKLQAECAERERQ